MNRTASRVCAKWSNFRCPTLDTAITATSSEAADSSLCAMHVHMLRGAATEAKQDEQRLVEHLWRRHERRKRK